MTAYAMFWLAGGNDILATTFHVSLNAVTYVCLLYTSRCV